MQTRYFCSEFVRSINNIFQQQNKITSNFPKEVPIFEHNIGRSLAALGDFLRSQEKNSNSDNYFPCYLRAFYHDNTDAFQKLLEINFSEKNSVANYCVNIIGKNLTHKNEAIFWLGNYLKQTGDYASAKKLFELGAKNKCHKSMLTLALYYQHIGQQEQMLSYFNLAEENGEIEASTHKGDYFKAIGDFESMKTSYEKGVKLGSMQSAFGMAEYYKEKGDIANMDKYFSIPLEYLNEEQVMAIIDRFGENTRRSMQKKGRRKAMDRACVSWC